MHKRGSGNSESVKIYFGIVVTSTLTAGRYSQSLRPTASVSDRIGAIADVFALYRLNKLRFRLHPAATTIMMCALPNYVDTAPNGFSQMSETKAKAYISSVYSVPTKWVNVDLAVIRGALPWYKTVAGAPDDWDEIACTLYLTNQAGTTGTEGFVYELEGEYEFRDPIDPGNTPKLIEARAQRRREEILKGLTAASPKDTFSSASLPSRKPPLG